MAEPGSGVHTDLSDLGGDAWRHAFFAAGRDGGFHEPLGPYHDAVCVVGGDSLVVTFEVDSRIEDVATDNAPRGWIMARDEGWSTLTLLSRGETWYRDSAVYDFFDRMTDGGFFEEFERVLFYGAGSAGYAAAAFSVAAPGSRVVALRPQATLDARTAGWDPRYRAHRRVSFEDRYGYAPDMLEAADAGYVLYDPAEDEDAMHAALFRKPNVTRLPCPQLGWNLDRNLHGMDILAPMMRHAMAGDLTEARFWALMRARRTHAPYLRSLLTRLEDSGRLELAKRVCRHAITKTPRPHFRKRLAALEDREAAWTAAQ
ncbi:hypothetical protein [Roseisalinus antarcticus]|uniref:Phosphoadenosine phosphosulfate reductase n=1 Tax=Roseisalinus antarcticus TaxID=254357 RepID=A0A1Y5RKI3_9RHOB|nr:hypothetical protein [Roseisalinus antarcticus]SLN19370.1 hypothetical protein ROA7023_00450 [Roseisalinus antarcticus]